VFGPKIVEMEHGHHEPGKVDQEMNKVVLGSFLQFVAFSFLTFGGI
jgi:hypothetical protein